MAIYGPGTSVDDIWSGKGTTPAKPRPYVDLRWKYVHDNFYTKAEVDKMFVDCAKKCNTTVTELIKNASISLDSSNYYDKAQIDQLLANVTVDLSNYYTKTQVDQLVRNSSSGSGTVVIDSSAYFTKSEVEEMFRNFIAQQAAVDASQNDAVEQRIQQVLSIQAAIDASQNQNLDDKIAALKAEQAARDASQDAALEEKIIIVNASTQQAVQEVSTAIQTVQTTQLEKDTAQDTSIAAAYDDSSANAATIAEQKVDTLVQYVREGDVSTIIINQGLGDVWADY